MFADAAIAFLKKQKNGKQPFFAYVAFTSPHDPRLKHPDYGKHYEADTITLPINFLPRHPFDTGDMNVRDEILRPVPRTEEAIKKRR